MTIANTEKSAKDRTGVLVVGSGISGVAAAVSAAREGASTTLVERGGLLGGLATNGLHSIYASQCLVDDGRPAYNSFSRELLERLFRGTDFSLDDPPPSGFIFDEQRLKLILSEILRGAGVTVLSHTFASEVAVEGEVVTGIFLETKAGRQFVETAAVVDATGSGTVAARAGCRNRPSSPVVSLAFKLGGVDVESFLAGTTGRRDPSEVESPFAGTITRRNSTSDGGVADGSRELDRAHVWKRHGIFCGPLRVAAPGNSSGLSLQAHGMRGRNELIMMRTPVTIPSSDPTDVAREQMRQQRETYEIVTLLREYVPGFRRATVVHNATAMAIEDARRIETRAGDRWFAGAQGQKDDPIIGVIDTKRPFQVAERLERRLGIPYSIIEPEPVSHLFVANPRVLDCRGDGLFQTHDVAATLGRAAGIAAAAIATGHCSRVECPKYVAMQVAAAEGLRIEL